jgi:hypothetical protein
MNKKSLFQMVLLVVLVVVGAVAYVYMQEGNLDFITQFIGNQPQEQQAKAPAVKTRAAQRTPPPPVVARKPEPPAIPSQPVKGQVNGKAFAIDASKIEGGALTLSQGSDVAVRLEVSTSPWETPIGKSFKLSPASGTESPRIAIFWKDDGSGGAKVKRFDDKYTLQLEFGQESNRKLPGKIYLVLPDEAKTSIAGTFEAEIRGFRIVDGKPDLTSDSVDTLQFLSLREALKDDPNKPLEDLAFYNEKFSNSAEEKTPTGYIETRYRAGAGKTQYQRLQFVKEDGEWRILRTLKLNEIYEAHPFKTPDSKDPSQMMIYLAAKKLETDVQKKHPEKGIFAAAVSARFSEKHKLGVGEVIYKLAPDGERLKSAYLFRFKQSGWALDRELGGKEKVNFDSGRIEKL